MSTPCTVNAVYRATDAATAIYLPTDTVNAVVSCMGFVAADPGDPVTFDAVGITIDAEAITFQTA